MTAYDLPIFLKKENTTKFLPLVYYQKIDTCMIV